MPADYLTLAELELRYEHAIPAALIAIAKAGGATALALQKARSERGFFRTLIKRQVGLIRARRKLGTLREYQIDDLQLYVRDFRRANRRVHALTKGES